jgi:hypothetical protein
MKCIVHLSKSFNSDGSCFLLRLTPLYSAGRNGAVETFSNERSLSRRMADIGLDRCTQHMSLSNLRKDNKAIWSNCEVAEGVFAHFGPVV